MSPVLEDDDAEGDGEGEGEAAPGCSRTFGWGALDYDGGLAAAGVADMSTHVHGLPLAIIMEETRSEVASVCTRRGREESGLVLVEQDSGMGGEVVQDAELAEGDSVPVRPAESRVSGIWDQSWKEGESTRCVCF